MPALIIFDIDGTLLETGRVTVPAVQRTFAAHGLSMPDYDTICGFFGKPVETYEAWLAEQCPPGMAEQIVAETNALELQLIGSEGRLYEGAREVLEELHGIVDAVDAELQLRHVPGVERHRGLAARAERAHRAEGKIRLVFGLAEAWGRQRQQHENTQKLHDIFLRMFHR